MTTADTSDIKSSDNSVHGATDIDRSGIEGNNDLSASYVDN